MLVLTRRIGETMMIGDDGPITVIGVKDDQVRFGANVRSQIRNH